MLRRFALVFTCAAVCSVVARAAVPLVYQNTAGSPPDANGNSYFYLYNGAGPVAVPTLDDGHLSSPGADITDFTFGYAVAPIGGQTLVDFDAIITFYNGKPSGEAFNDVTSTTPLFSARIPLRGLSADTVHLHAQGVSASFTIPTQDFAVEEMFVDPSCPVGYPTPSDYATDVAAPFIAPGAAQVGFNDDLAYEDGGDHGNSVGGPLDGVFQASEADNFGAPGYHLGYYFQMHGNAHGGTAVPEPGTLALLGTIAPLAGIVIRRKRA